ncbi:MAG: PspC domain-containing protein [Candidatus Margulisiibacteriota bacterium]|jgi:phage shock protein PspC (stress-responsive transcriptional regulator)
MDKRLYRSKKDRMLAGVAGGLAEYFNIDPVIVRLLFAFSAFTVAGFFAYLILWIIVPEAPGAEGQPATDLKKEIEEKAEALAEVVRTEAKKIENNDTRSNMLGGFILLAIGSLFLLGNFLPIFDLGRLWPLILIVIGIGLVAKRP